MPIVVNGNTIRKIRINGLWTKEVWANDVQRFGDVVAPPPDTELEFVESLANLVTGTTTQNIPINGTNIQVGDTVIIITRTDSATPTSITLFSGNTVSLLAQRANGFNDALTIWKFVASASEAGNSSVNATINVNVPLYADAMIVRGKDLASSYNATNGLNTSGVVIPSTGIPTNNGESLLIGAFSSVGTSPASIATIDSSFEISGSLGTPKTGITGLCSIVSESALTNGILSQSPTGSGQTIVGIWLN